MTSDTLNRHARHGLLLLTIEFGGLYVDEALRTLRVRVTQRRPKTMADLWHALREGFPGNELPARIQLVDARFTFEQP